MYAGGATASCIIAAAASLLAHPVSGSNQPGVARATLARLINCWLDASALSDGTKHTVPLFEIGRLTALLRQRDVCQH